LLCELKLEPAKICLTKLSIPLMWKFTSWYNSRRNICSRKLANRI